MITFDDLVREYGLDNPLFTYTVSGAVLGDAESAIFDGLAGSLATIASNVGSYLISGSFTSPSGYLLQVTSGTLTIVPATLTFTADPFSRFFGDADTGLTGSVAGFRNGDTWESIFGSSIVWTTSATPLSPIGYYMISGGGTMVGSNYVITQAASNATALQIMPRPQVSDLPTDFVRETVDTYVYDRNFGSAPMCAINVEGAATAASSGGDMLANEWSKVRSRPNLSNCFDSERRNSCGDF